MQGFINTFIVAYMAGGLVCTKTTSEEAMRGFWQNSGAHHVMGSCRIRSHLMENSVRVLSNLGFAVSSSLDAHRTVRHTQ